jgi:hypothetical protein
MWHIMSELHERFSDRLSEPRWQPGALPAFHRGENNQSYRPEEQEHEAIKVRQINIELLNMPILALEMRGSKRAETPDSINSDTTIRFVDIIEIILEMIGDWAKAMFPKRKAKK